MDEYRPYVAFDDELARLRAERSREADDWMPPVDWHALFRREISVDWLVEDFWPIGRQLHIHGARKAKKSLVALWVAANLATGRDPFSARKISPCVVTYVDCEMTEEDLLERLEDMEFVPETLSNLRYQLHPALPPLDTEAGGQKLLRLVKRDESSVVFIDTLSRVVQGKESDNDTYRDFYAYTGQHLKANHVALWRTDHEGHEEGRSRGASSKADDVDIVWQLRETEEGVSLVRKASRVSWIPPMVALRQGEPLSFARTEYGWPSGTADKANEMDKLGLPLDISKRDARKAFKENNVVAGRNETLLAAIRYRQSRAELP